MAGWPGTGAGPYRAGEEAPRREEVCEKEVTGRRGTTTQRRSDGCGGGGGAWLELGVKVGDAASGDERRWWIVCPLQRGWRAPGRESGGDNGEEAARVLGERISAWTKRYGGVVG